MQAKEFTHDLYRKIWVYIIKEREFWAFLEKNEEPEYFHEDFYSDNVPRLIRSLKNEIPFFYETYSKVVGSIENIQERNLIMDFMTWYKNNEDVTGNDIYEAINDGGFIIVPLNKLTEHIKTYTIPEPSASEIAKTVGDSLAIISNALEKFTTASKSLLIRRKDKVVIDITDEYDVQDILHVMLRPHFPTVRIEEVVAGNADERFLKIDFLINSIKVAIECKYIHNATHAYTVTKEINDDIQTYHRHQDCNYLIFFLYDKNMNISSPDVMENSYSKKQTFDGKEMTIDLKIRPKN